MTLAKNLELCKPFLFNISWKNLHKFRTCWFIINYDRFNAPKLCFINAWKFIGFCKAVFFIRKSVIFFTEIFNHIVNLNFFRFKNFFANMEVWALWTTKKTTRPNLAVSITKECRLGVPGRTQNLKTICPEYQLPSCIKPEQIMAGFNINNNTIHLEVVKVLELMMLSISNILSLLFCTT